MVEKQYFGNYFCNHKKRFICFKIVTSQPWKHLQKAISWMVSQAAWAWAKTGIMEPDYAGAYGYVNDEETATHGDHDDHESEEKSPPADPKDERAFDDSLVINRTRLEVCDQEVNIAATL